MAFFDFIFKKQKNKAPFIEDFREIMVQYQGKQIMYGIRQGLITYKNVISTRDCVCHFPEGYFDVNTRMLLVDDQKRMYLLMNAAVSQLTFTNTLDTLPPGASHEALMICTKDTGERIYYSNCHLSESGFSVRVEPIFPLFIELFNTLSDFCAFMSLSDDVVLESQIGQSNMRDQRYFEETLWFCDSCSTGNLMEHCNCIKCGSPRP